MSKVEVIMPKMGESVMEGTVLTWHKNIGDSIETDETIVEIGTDKVDSEVPSPASGILVEILVPEGEVVAVNTPIAIIETDAAQAVVAAAPQSATAEVVETAPTAVPVPTVPDAPVAESAPQVQTSGETVAVIMPKMGESVMEGTVLTWHKKIGDKVETDETVLEIGTDKVDTEVPSPASGVLVEILVPEGEVVEVGTVLAKIATGEVSIIQAPTAPSPVTAAPQPVNPPVPPSTGANVSEEEINLGKSTLDGRFLTPLVRSIAEKEGLTAVDLAQINGSGQGGRITKHDILALVENRKSGETPPQKYAASTTSTASVMAVAPTSSPIAAASDGGRVEIVKMDRMRQIIADHMTHSKATSAHVTSFAEIDVTNLVKLREQQKARFQQLEGLKLTFTPFFVHAAVEALKAHPQMNASVDGHNIIVKKDYHVGIAVAIGKTGLLVPSVRNAGTLNLTGLAKAIDDVAQRARNKQLSPDELSGGTFTVTNVGSLGSIMGTPIINQPQVAILATGAITKRPVVIEVPGIGDTIGIRHMMYVSLSYDHRIIDGAMAASFLQMYKATLEAIDPNGNV